MRLMRLAAHIQSKFSNILFRTGVEKMFIGLMPSDARSELLTDLAYKVL
jgi:hypothetical protein